MVNKFFLVSLFALIPLYFLLTSDNDSQISECQSIQMNESNQISVENNAYHSLLLITAASIGNLPAFDLSDVKTFDQYKQFVDTMNDSVKILNEKLGYQIPYLAGTQEEYERSTKIITKYTPLVNSYNKMIYSAKQVDTSNQNSITCFYIQSATFSLELTLISTAIYSGTAYGLVGTIYRSSGLQSVAFKCASCVSTILSNAHWFVRATFVEGTAVAFSTILHGINKMIISTSTP